MSSRARLVVYLGTRRTGLRQHGATLLFDAEPAAFDGPAARAAVTRRLGEVMSASRPRLSPRQFSSRWRQASGFLRHNHDRGTVLRRRQT